MTESTGFYGPSFPLVAALAGPLFFAGLLWAIRKRRFMPVLWALLAMFFGGFLLKATPGSSHFVVIIPAIVWLIAILLDGVMERGHPRLALALLAVIMAADLFLYFGVYLPSGTHPHLDLPFPPGPFH